MDKQTIFERTSKGEAELHSSTLIGDIKRALLLVDGTSSLAELEKHALPSLRNSLSILMSELYSKGLIEDASRFSRVPKLVIPAKPKPTGEIKSVATSEFDFTAAYRPPTAAMLAEEAAKEALLSAKLKDKQDIVRRIQAEKEVAKEVENARLEVYQAKKQAALEAQVRADAERHALELAEQARLKEQAIAQAHAELEKLKALAQAEADARVAAELKVLAAAELRVRQEAEIAKLKARQVLLAKAHAAETAALAAADQLKAQQAAALKEQQEKARLMAEREAQDIAERSAQEITEPDANEMAKTMKIKVDSAVVRPENIPKSEKTDPNLRTTTATVLFFDMVAYTKQPVHKQTGMKKLFNQLVMNCLQSVSENRDEYIILDTGDGAAIGFIQHPEEALEVAIKFRDAITSEAKYVDLKVRMGIHLGPINIVVDMNGKPNMVGNGINDAQRVMDFAGVNQLFISRSYYDFVSRLSDEFAEQFYYRGAQKDKHGHEHQVYALNSRTQPHEYPSITADAPTVKIALAPFTLNSIAHESAVATPVVIDKPVVIEPSPTEIASRSVEIQHAKDAKQLEEIQAKKLALMAEIAAQKQADAQATEVKKLAEMQTKAWNQAERRVSEAVKANAERAVLQAASASVESVVKGQKIETAPRAPLPWRNIFIGLTVFLLLAFGAALYVVPIVMPMQEYELKTEQFLADKLQQPVHIGQMRARLLPSPQVTFDDFFMGESNQIRVSRVTVNLAVLTLISPHKTITDIQLEGLKVSGSGLEKMGGWLESVAGDETYPIQTIAFKQAMLETPTFKVEDIEGSFSFNPLGQLILTDLRGEGGKFGATVSHIGAKQELKLSVRNAVLPFLPNWQFNELHATGALTADGISLTQLDASIAGGFLQGSADISWYSGWLVQGNLNAESLDLQKFNRHLVGDLKGLVHFKMQSSEFKNLVASATLGGDFVASKGVIQGIDLIEILRTRGREKAVGGRTNFDTLAGSLSYSKSRYEFRQLDLKKGVLNATGEVVLEQNKLLGHINATLEIQGEKPAVSIQIEGTAKQFNQKVL